MTTTRSQEHKDDKSTTTAAATGDKREASGEHEDHSKKRVKKVVVQKEQDKEGGGEGKGEPKQQKLTTEGGAGGEEKEKKSEEVPTQEKQDSSTTAQEDKDDGKEEKNLTAREQGEKDQGKNAEPGEEPDLSHVAKEDYERKHGTLETGHVYFLFRPKVEVSEAHSLDDISKFHLLLVPHHSKLHRLIAIGKKVLPDHEQSSRPLWGEVLNVGEDMKSLKKNLGAYTYETKTLGTRHQPGARVAASGAYVLHATENYPKDSANASAVWKTDFAYEVAVPHEMGEVQEALHIHPEGVFAIQVKNPEAPSNNPAVPNQDPSKHPQFPDSLKSLFKTRYIPADPPALLDYPGTELLLLPSKHKVSEAIGDNAEKELEAEEKELESDIGKQENGNEAKKALKEMGLEGLIEGKALEGHWE
ncbi:uncharacterized protein JCM6883_005026 [Sporobolomyces salmoneus]|uniref:uncharacterized protein n=1 Tax=Sporobolomyces salmoneus TaxID=183962 RepID=UPI0031790A14